MRRHTVRTTVGLCAAASLAAVMGTASAAPPGAQAVKQQPAASVLVDCFWHPDVRPTDFILACGDGNSRLVSMHWSQWLPDAATAEGVNVVNDCEPYCAAGRFHPYPVTVRLDHPQPWKKHPELQHYTRMTLVYTDARPEGYEQVVSYPLWN